MVGVVWLLVARAPRHQGDPGRHTAQVLVLTGAQVLTVGLYLLGLAYTELHPTMATAALLAWLWLAVPVGAAFTARTGAAFTASAGADKSTVTAPAEPALASATTPID